MNIFDIRSNIWINANAGSGKTTALVGRFLSLLLNGARHDEILCITYTNVGADEMRHRIKNTLQKWSQVDDIDILNDISKFNLDESYVSVALSLFEKIKNSKKKIKISTIHSFCYEELLNHGLTSSITKDTKILTSKEIQKIKSQIKHLLHNEDSLKHEIEFISTHSTSTVIIENIIDLAIEHYKDISHKTLDFLALDEIKEYTDIEHDAHIRIIDRLLNNKNIAIALKTEITDLDSLRKAIFTNTGSVRKSVEKLNNQHINEAIDQINLFDKTIEAKFSSYGINIAIFAARQYENIKKKQNAITYDDMLTIMHEILHKDNDKWVNYLLDNKISHILLDEAQDTNPLSWEIITKLTEEFFDGHGIYEDERTIFVVGDEKQSIFSFQGANIQLLQKYKELFKSKSDHAGINFIEGDLNISYRSTSKILNFVDKYCNKINNKSSLTSDLKKDIHHISGVNGDTESKINVIQIEKSESLDTEKKSSWIKDVKDDNLLELSTILENEIEEFIKNDVKLNEIMVLFRSRGSKNYIIFDLIDVISKKYQVSLTDKINYDIYFLDLLAIFKFITLQNDNLNLGFLLKSDLFNFTDSEIQYVTMLNGDNLFEKLASDGHEKSRYAYNILNALLLFVNSKQVDIYALLLYINSKLIKNNKKHKEYLAIIYESIKDKNILSIYELTEYLADTDLYQDEKEDGIRFSTIHNAKGSEADAVIILDLDSSEYKRDRISLIDNKFHIRPKTGTMFETVNNFMESDKSHALAENVRINYVAITRARRFLSIVTENPELWS